MYYNLQVLPLELQNMFKCMIAIVILWCISFAQIKHKK